MPFYSSYTSYGRLVNSLQFICDRKNLSSYKLSKLADLSPATTRKIYGDSKYIPSPDVLERLCIVLQVDPGELLQILPIMSQDYAVTSGVCPSGL